MKKIFSIGFLLILFLAGCSEKKSGIEILTNPEASYLSEKEVEIPAEVKEAGYNFNNDLIDAVKSIHQKNTADKLRYIISLRLYINENGKVEKIKDISSFNDRLEIGPDSVENFTNRDKLNQALAEQISKWRFIPAKKEEKSVKSYMDLKGADVIAYPDGKFNVELQDFLSGIFDGSNQYYVAAEVMPDPIGGIKGIQEKILYPEEAKRTGIQGKVYVLAFIDENGNVVKTKILKGVGYGCDEAAVNAIKNTKFTPAKQKGENVKVQVVVPIVFKL